MKVLLAVVFLASGARAGTASPDDVKRVLKEHPEILIQAIKENRAAVADVLEEALREKREKGMRERAESHRKQFEESFASPLAVAVGEDSHVRGDRSAKYTLVEYSDFECPYCGAGYKLVEDLRKRYGSDLRFVFKNLPLSIHPMAMPAARWFEAAWRQSPDKAWKLYDELFQNQNKLSEYYLRTAAVAVGLDPAKLAREAASAKVQAHIDSEIAEARKLGFTGTPTFVFNGVPVRGIKRAEFFDEILARTRTRR